MSDVSAASFMRGKEWHELRVNFVEICCSSFLLKTPSAVFADSSWIHE